MRCWVVKRFKNEKQELENNTVFIREPVQLLEDRTDGGVLVMIRAAAS